MDLPRALDEKYCTSSHIALLKQAQDVGASYEKGDVIVSLLIVYASAQSGL